MARSLVLGNDVFDPGEIPRAVDEWPASRRTNAIGKRIRSTYPVLPEYGEDYVVGIFLDEGTVSESGVDPLRTEEDPRAPHINPQRDAAERLAVQRWLGPNLWKASTLHGPPPLSQGGYVWVGDTGLFVQLLLDTANTVVSTLSTWGGAAAVVYAAINIVKRRGGRARVNKGAARAIAAAELRKRIGDRTVENLFVRGFEDEDVLSDGYLVGFADSNRMWTVVVDRTATC